jgi:hypothetical protein
MVVDTQFTNIGPGKKSVRTPPYRIRKELMPQKKSKGDRTSVTNREAKNGYLYKIGKL